MGEILRDAAVRGMTKGSPVVGLPKKKKRTYLGRP